MNIREIGEKLMAVNPQISRRWSWLSSSDALFQLKIVVEDKAAHYRLKISRPETSEPIWHGDRLEPNTWSELFLTVPIALMSPGVYKLRLDRLVDGHVKHVGEYGLTIEVE